MTLTGRSQYECLENCPTALMVLNQPGTATFTCTYELSVGATTTNYSWYVDGVRQSTTTRTTDFTISSGDHTVECRVNIVVDVGCECDGRKHINITALGTQYA